ncbi:MAG: gamma-glutamyltransferase [Acidobacteriota bacterium]
MILEIRASANPVKVLSRSALALTVALQIGGCAHGDQSGNSCVFAALYAPEAHSDLGMVSTGSSEATRAGVRILESGGNAIDAAVAAALALGVADPGGSGLGGMTYILISFADGRSLAVDGSAIVPVRADRTELARLHASEERFGARAVAVPMALAAMSHALEQNGTMTFARVAAPAIEIAENGYLLSPNSISWTNSYLDDIMDSRYLRFVVLNDGKRVGAPGDLVCRPDLASTLRTLAAEGPESFYRGSVARSMLIDLASLGGYIRPIDLVSTRAKELQPLSSEYRGAEVLSYPWPGGGGEVVAMLNILEQLEVDLLRTPSAERMHVMIEASRLAHADFLRSASSRAQQTSSLSGHLSRTYARERAGLITPGRALPEDLIRSSGSAPRMGNHTTHISVADRWGNAVAMTQTLCRQYGAKVATPGLGFPYNSCLEFFDFENEASPIYLHPRALYASNMAPTIVRHDGTLLILGSAGSDRIPGSVVEVISNVFDRQMGIRDAVTAPRALWNSAHDPDRICIEIADPISHADADELQSFGFEHMFRLDYLAGPVNDAPFFGGVNAVLYQPATGKYSGVGDPRRNGLALGPRAIVEREGHP